MLPGGGGVELRGSVCKLEQGTAAIWRSMESSMQKATLALLDAFEFQLSSSVNARVAIDGLCSEIRKKLPAATEPESNGEDVLAGCQMWSQSIN